MDFFLIGVAGFIGAISRYLVYTFERSLTSHLFPYGTLFINLLGCFLAGIVLAYAEKAAVGSRHFLMLFSVGFIGSFTTFSAFSAETFQLMQNNLFHQVALNIVLNVALGIFMVWGGKSLTYLLW